jgi:hypothetical protein
MNSGRGIADDLFLVAEFKLPEGGSFSYGVDARQLWDLLQGANELAMISKAFPSLPPGVTNKIVTLVLHIPFPAIGDVTVALTCGSRGGPGVARTITIPNVILAPAAEHFTDDSKGSSRDKEIKDRMHQVAISECISA